MAKKILSRGIPYNSARRLATATDGNDFPFSQFITVLVETPSFTATSRCVRPAFTRAAAGEIFNSVISFLLSVWNFVITCDNGKTIYICCQRQIQKIFVQKQIILYNVKTGGCVMSDEEQKRIFAENLRYYLDQHGYTQIEVAEKIGVSQQRFSSWCAGRAIPRMDKIQALADFNLYSTNGVSLIYVYFQIPLSTLLLIPAFEGVRKEWQEASTLLGATKGQFWTRVGIPVLMPSIMGTFSVLFANALAAYATVYAIMMNSISLLPIQIAGCFVGEVKIRTGLGGALSVVMMVIMVIMILITNAISHQFQKGGKQS